MSCDIAVSAALLLAAFNPAEAPRLDRVAAVAAPRTNPIAHEPLFADIVMQARSLAGEVDGFRHSLASGASLPPLDAFRTRIVALAELDMKGHFELEARGLDSDLKCILRGIAQDLPLKLNDVIRAADPRERDLALSEMSYLLIDNVEVILAPPQPPV